MHVDSVGTSKFSERVQRLLERVEYRTARSREDKAEIYRLRYDAYMREGAIEPNPSRMFHDVFDEAANVWIIGMYVDGELASSIRLHIASAPDDPLPATTVFPDFMLPLLRKGLVVVDPTRFVTSLDFSRQYPEMPYLTVRPGWMAGDYFHADYILATIRSEHQAYYRRVFGHVSWCPARDYPTLRKPIACMGLDFFAERERVHGRYPFYVSSAEERNALFDLSSNPSGRTGAIGWDAPSETFA
jgi:hypothetical protein